MWQKPIGKGRKMIINKFTALQAFAMAVGHSQYAWKPRAPVSDWEHDDERLKKAEEKRSKKAAKRLKEIK